MKKFLLFTTLMITSVAGAIAKPKYSEIDNVKKAILKYVRGADQRDVQALDDVFHKEVKFVAHMKSKDLLFPIDKKSYLDMIKAGKIGGVERDTNFGEIQIDENLAQAKVTLKAGNTTFHDHLSLIKIGSDWKVMFNLTRMEAN